MKAPKVIFLDFDGVLNTEEYQARLRAVRKNGCDEYGQLFDPAAVANLKMILETIPGTHIVISSSWKLEGLGRMREMWASRGLPGAIHSVTPDYVPELQSIDLNDYCNIAMLAGKGNEVKAWLEQYAPQGCDYIIFDDVPDFLPEQEKHLIVTNPIIGITRDDALAASHQTSFRTCLKDGVPFFSYFCIITITRKTYEPS